MPESSRRTTPVSRCWSAPPTVLRDCKESALRRRSTRRALRLCGSVVSRPRRGALGGARHLALSGVASGRGGVGRAARAWARAPQPCVRRTAARSSGSAPERADPPAPSWHVVDSCRHVQPQARRCGLRAWRILDRKRVLVVAGSGAGEPEAVLDAAEALGAPVLADPLSGCRRHRRGVVAACDAILRDDAAASLLRPDVVVRLGAPARVEGPGDAAARMGARGNRATCSSTTDGASPTLTATRAR